MSLVLTAAEQVHVLRFAHDVLTDESLQTVRRCLEEPGALVVHLDLSDVRLPTAEGLGSLVVLSGELRARGGALLLVNVPPATREVLAVTHLHEVLDVRPE